jgi:hypothetical protein
MKKLLVILMTLCLVMSLPLLTMAEETTTAPETVEETTTAHVEETTPAPVTVEDTAPAEDESVTENETEAETEYKMNVGFYPETLLTTLPIMGMGMLGIFVVTCVIVLAVVILSKLGKEKDE